MITTWQNEISKVMEDIEYSAAEIIEIACTNKQKSKKKN